MRFFGFDPDERKRYLPSIAAGLLLAVSFPKIHWAGLAWIAPGLMLGSAVGLGGGAAFRTGYVAGLAYYLGSLYWLLCIPESFAPIVGWLALAAYLSFYPALWVWLCWRIFPGQPVPDRVREQSGPTAFAETLRPLLAVNWVSRLGWSCCCAALWVAWEMIQARLFTGFPWTFLGVTQYETLPLIQIAAWTGVYGVSFLVAWFSVALACAAAAVMRGAAPAWVWGRELLVPLLAAAAVAGYGLSRVINTPAPTARLKVLLVQPAIPQTVIWDEKGAPARFGQLMALSESGLTNDPDLLIWPESAVPNLFRWETNEVFQGQSSYAAITGLATRHKVWFILSADDAEPRAGAKDAADYYNSSFLVTPEGKLAGSYRKQKLVVFGEYVPLSRWLPFLMDFVHVYGAFTPGKGPVAFDLRDLRVRTSTLICFEDVFPHLARQYVQADTDFLVNLTNDGWFGESAEQWQHAANAVFRAVENGLPLVRATNNGLTCWIDACGGLHEVFFPGSHDVYRAGFKVAYVPILAGQRRASTFYNRHGDWFGWGCLSLSGVVVCLRRLRRSK